MFWLRPRAGAIDAGSSPQRRMAGPPCEGGWGFLIPQIRRSSDGPQFAQGRELKIGGQITLNP